MICISSGHGTLVRGAKYYLDEVDEACRVVDRVARLIGALPFHDTTSTSQDENLKTIVDWHNSQDRDLDVSVHFNAYKPTEDPMGVEVLYVTQEALADNVCLALADIGFLNRGPKFRDDLYFLNNTDQPAILIEVCFVDSEADADLYRECFNEVCQAIASSIAEGAV